MAGGHPAVQAGCWTSRKGRRKARPRHGVTVPFTTCFPCRDAARLCLAARLFAGLFSFFFNGAWKVVASFVVFGFIAFVLCGTATSWPQLSALANTGCPCSCFFSADAVSLRSKPVQVSYLVYEGPC